MSLTRRILLEKRRLVYPLLAAIVVNAAVFVAVVYPLSVKVASGEQTAVAASQQLAAARAQADAARATVTGKAAADAELRKFYGAVLPADSSAARSITFAKVDQLAKQAGFTVDDASYDPESKRDSALVKLTESLVLTGDYAKIRRLIYALETTPEFLVLENVELSQDSDEGQGLNVTMRIATYYRTGGDGN